jgi:hypothetical protein
MFISHFIYNISQFNFGTIKQFDYKVVNARKCVAVKGKHSQDSQVEFTFWKLKVMRCPKFLDQGLGNQVLSKLGLL